PRPSRRAGSGRPVAGGVGVRAARHRRPLRGDPGGRAAMSNRSEAGDARTVVVLGPRTRLGQQVVRQALAAGAEVVAVARHERDEKALSDSPATVVRIEELGRLAPGPVRVLVCAMGPVQSGDRVATADVERDLAAVDSLLAGATAAEVVLVSSVLALAPKADRRHYGGWKCLVEDRLTELAEAHGARLAVLYPGRLVEGERRGPRNLLGTR